jgi:hypothetical protein
MFSPFSQLESQKGIIHGTDAASDQLQLFTDLRQPVDGLTERDGSNFRTLTNASTSMFFSTKHLPQ